MSSRGFWSLPIVLLLSGCLSALWPMRNEDLHAPGEVYRSANPEKSTCTHLVELWPSTPLTARPYKEIAKITATCYPGAITICERRLRDRACQLGADAVIAVKSEAGGTPPGASQQSLVSRSGRAVRFEIPPETSNAGLAAGT